MDKEKAEAILNAVIVDGDLEGDTIRDFFKACMHNLWMEGECFSGKRPLGNGGWELEVVGALIEGGLLDGSPLDEFDGYAYNPKEADALITGALEHL